MGPASCGWHPVAFTNNSDTAAGSFYALALAANTYMQATFYVPILHGSQTSISTGAQTQSSPTQRQPLPPPTPFPQVNWLSMILVYIRPQIYTSSRDGLLHNSVWCPIYHFTMTNSPEFFVLCKCKKCWSSQISINSFIAESFIDTANKETWMGLQFI